MTKQITGTKEWSNRSINIMRGCRNNCLYGYCKADALRWKRIENPEDWQTPVLNQKMLEKPISKRSGITMFPSTHDLHLEYLPEIIDFLHKLLFPGNQVLIVSKPYLEVITALCKELKAYKNQILFRFTIGSAYNNVLKFWEPGATSFEERIHCLQHVFYRGYKTSVSCEPMLDGRIDDVIEMTRHYVTDSIWLGKMNFPERRIKANCGNQIVDMAERLQVIHITQSDKAIQKLYEKYKDNPIIKWKESIKKVVGLDLATEKGLDE